MNQHLECWRAVPVSHHNQKQHELEQKGKWTLTGNTSQFGEQKYVSMRIITCLICYITVLRILILSSSPCPIL